MHSRMDACANWSPLRCARQPNAAAHCPSNSPDAHAQRAPSQDRSMSYFANAGQILVGFAFGAIITLVVLRVLLQLLRANFYDPVCQFLYKTTNPVLMPLRRVIPGWRALDVGAVLLAWLLTGLKLYLLYRLAGRQPGLAGLAVMALADLADFVLLLYFALILVRA